MSTIAFLGLGTMGAGMARNLVAAGHEVIGWNRTRDKAEQLRAELGIEIAEHPVDAARVSGTVILCVSSDDAVHELVFGADGVLLALAEGDLLLDCGTTSRALSQAIEAACAERRAGFVDAPMTGSKLGAEGGRLTFMVGGPTELVERATPLFEVMGGHHVHVGEMVGLGQAAKYCLNMAQAVMLQGVLEGYTLAKLLGVPLAKMSDIYQHSAAKSGIGSFKTPYLQAGDYSPHFRLDLMHKDLHLALDEAERRRVPLAAATAVRGIYDQAVAEGMGGQDFLALATLLERWSKIALRD
ncbi:3-hydroxyisobutyrate dehydrogenase [Enhygromyxa salina]|uniref:3-hydroxyisobutyrate dehydrogenase n=1 Tax=Enhygromyxa salina TaxID=215803 RepID=A0A2S9YDY4_9BACT|nr:NAD(P)-dependent oxidoreductase [Enhygromyxa salina]PRQ03305.1 3-hydroxyisobutyrate dehydrogenase [Enhygromyxa salina]